MNIKSVLASEEDGNQVALGYPIVNFKHRTELRRVQDETKPEDSVHIAEGRSKRRKLLRPDFGTNELSNESKGIGSDHSGSLQLLPQDISEYKGNNGKKLDENRSSLSSYESCFKKETAKDLIDLNCEAEGEQKIVRCYVKRKDSSHDSTFEVYLF